MKKSISILCVLLLVLSLFGCNEKAEGNKVKDYGGQTVIGKITAITETSITITLGEWVENEAETMLMPEDMSGMEMPTMSEGEFKPEDVGGNPNGGGNPSEIPSGDNGETQSGDRGMVDPNAQGGNMDMPGDMGVGGFASGTFTSGDESVTLNTSDAKFTISFMENGVDASIYTLTLGTIVSVEVGEGNLAKTVDILSTVGLNNGFGGNESGFDSFDVETE